MNAAAEFLQTLAKFGVDCLFANPGSEFIPLIEAYDHLQKDGAKLPRAITVPHEALAVSMAYGFYLATGRPQAVMVHVTVGTANALVGLINASRMNVPLLFVAGRTPRRQSGAAGSRDRFVHWAQESFDQGAMTREFVKWDYEVQVADNLQPALQRAFSLMNSAPRGPVSLSLSREVFYESAAAAGPRPPASAPVALTQEVVAQLAALLQKSKRPLLLTSRSGMDARTVPLLEAAATKHGLAVVCPQAQAVNLRSGHENFVGYANAGALREADLILVLDTDVPWLPHEAAPHPAAHIVHIGEDPLFSRLPMRDFAATTQTVVVADAFTFLTELNNLPAGTATWTRALRENYLRQRALVRDQLQGLSAHQVSASLSRVLNEETVLLNELSLPADLLDLNFAGGYWRSGSASGLGWALGCALGIRLALPKKVVISVVGDGVYYLANPLAAQWVAQANELPTVTVVLNNQGMPSVHAKGTFTSLSPSLNFAEIARASGSEAWRVSTAHELDEALPQAIRSVQKGRAALIEVCL